ncbi:hypothetical protein AMTRI_Chr08g202630 [Amborella trichopoda]
MSENFGKSTTELTSFSFHIFTRNPNPDSKLTVSGDARVDGVSSTTENPNPSSETTVMGGEHPVQNPSPNSGILLLGDAKITADGRNVNSNSFVKLNEPWPLSAGSVVFKHPIRVSVSKLRAHFSFSSYFTFSISPGNGERLALVFLPRKYLSEPIQCLHFRFSSVLDPSCKFPNMFAIEFDTSMNSNSTSFDGNQVGFDPNTLVSIKAADTSSIGLVLNNDTTLHSWIHYHSISQTLEVRISNSIASWPLKPLISIHKDLSRIWVKELFVGITGSNGNSTQTSVIYSWSFDGGYNWKNQHSMPVDPRTLEVKNGSFGGRINVICRTMVALIWGIGIGAIAALSVFVVWNLFMSRYKSSVADYGGKKPVDLGYEKIQKARQKGCSCKGMA